MMRFLFVALFSLISISSVFSQSSEPQRMSSVELEIRRLDLAEARAFKEKDKRLIEQFFAKNSVVNNPRNSLTFGSVGVVAATRLGASDYFSFDRNIESVQIYAKTAIVMGDETVVLKNETGGAGVTVRRRYTNIWMKTGKMWQIVARHANVICP